MLKKHKHLLQISVHKLHNDNFLPIDQGGFSCAGDDKCRLWIGDTQLRNYIQNHIKWWIKQSKIPNNSHIHTRALDAAS